MDALPLADLSYGLIGLVSLAASVVWYLFLYQAVAPRLGVLASWRANARIAAARLRYGPPSRERCEQMDVEAGLHEALLPPVSPVSARYDAHTEPVREMWLPGVEWSETWHAEGEGPTPPRT